jgi:hypothetical protein
MLMALDEISESLSCNSDSATSTLPYKRLSKYGQKSILPINSTPSY